jgi:two-component sensor histidine kinase/CHASE3 domain sensor protein
MGMQQMTAMNLTDGISSRKTAARPGRRLANSFAVLASLALVMLAAVAALALMQGINRQIDDIVHTYEVRNQARELTVALTEAESAQRGYLLTRDDNFLQSYRRSGSDIGNRLMELTGLTKDDPEQGERVRGIASEIIGKSAEMDRSVALVEAQRAGDARRLIETGIGERLMGNLQVALQQFVDEENARLLDRNVEIDGYRRGLVAAIITALAGAVILAYALFSRTQRKVGELARSTDQLHSENEVLEAHVLERTKALDEARAHAELERQRVEALLQDASHRIGNSLATVSSLLGLQLLRSQSEEVKAALESARSRVHAIASAHRRLRLGGDLETTSADEFLGAVLDDIAITATESNPVRLSGEFDPITVNARDATTVGILVAELVTNALKHGFPDGRAGTVRVSLKRNPDGLVVLKVVDDGVGLAEGLQPGEGGLGSVIVGQLATQFGGQPHYEAGPAGGLSVTVPMPGIGSGGDVS